MTSYAERSKESNDCRPSDNNDECCPDTKTDRFLNSAIYGIGVLLTLFTIYYAYEYPMSRLRYSNILVASQNRLDFTSSSLN